MQIISLLSYVNLILEMFEHMKNYLVNLSFLQCYYTFLGGIIEFSKLCYMLLKSGLRTIL